MWAPRFLGGAESLGQFGHLEALAFWVLNSNENEQSELSNAEYFFHMTVKQLIMLMH